MNNVYDAESILIKLKHNGEALVVAALTGFTWSSVGLAEVKLRTKKKTIGGAFQNSNTGIPNTYPTMQIWKPILASCPDGD